MARVIDESVNPEVLDYNAEVKIKSGNAIYGEFLAEQVERLIKSHGTIKTYEILKEIK